LLDALRFWETVIVGREGKEWVGWLYIAICELDFRSRKGGGKRGKRREEEIIVYKQPTEY
jgi:hypothetical protein